MAIGTGKTLTAAAVIRMFLRTGNAKRVLFLVDRLELETQAWNAFVRLLKNDFRTVIYKENRDNWRNAEIVVSTVQSLPFNNKYRRAHDPLTEAAKILGLRVLDHVMVSKKGHFSFQEAGLIGC